MMTVGAVLEARLTLMGAGTALAPVADIAARIAPHNRWGKGILIGPHD